MFNPVLMNVALASVPVHQSGLAAGVNDTFRQAGTRRRRTAPLTAPGRLRSVARP